MMNDLDDASYQRWIRYVLGNQNIRLIVIVYGGDEDWRILMCRMLIFS